MSKCDHVMAHAARALLLVKAFPPSVSIGGQTAGSSLHRKLNRTNISVCGNELPDHLTYTYTNERQHVVGTGGAVVASFSGSIAHVPRSKHVATSRVLQLASCTVQMQSDGGRRCG